MQAAFIDIGLEQAAFIHADDIVQEEVSTYQALFNPGEEQVDEEINYEGADDDQSKDDIGRCRFDQVR